MSPGTQASCAALSVKNPLAFTSSRDMETPEYPENIYIGITDKCNARCIMCWRNNAQGPFLDMDSKLLAKLETAMRHAKFIGWWGDGEIFCHSDIDGILDRMRSLPYVAHSFSTNGKLLAKYARDLASVNLREITISIDAADPELLGRIRKGVTLGEIVDGVTAVHREFDLVERPRPEIWFYFISMVQNIGNLPSLVRLAAELGVRRVWVGSLKVNSPELLRQSLPLQIPGMEAEVFRSCLDLASRVGVDLVHCDPAAMKVEKDAVPIPVE